MTKNRSRLGRAWGASLLFALACQSDALVAPITGEFVLRTVSWDVDNKIAVPGTFPSVRAGDSIRVIAGAFVLLPGSRWASKWDRVLVTDGIASQRRTLSSAGSYRVISRTEAQTVLDLYPGQITPANVAPTAVIRGDSLYHSAFVYSR